MSQRIASSSTTSMATLSETKACAPCSKAKRKCDKQLPACGRCQSREISCTYPSSPPSCWVLLDSMQTPSSNPVDMTYMYNAAASPTPISPSSTTPFSSTTTTTHHHHHHHHHHPPSPATSSSIPLPLHLQTAAWFLTPDTWLVTPIAPGDSSVLRNLLLRTRRYVRRMQSLVSDWVVKGSSPIFHARLYQVRFPPTAQAAYTALATYLTRIPATEGMILRVVGDRATELVRAETQKGGEKETDTFDHLARVHALLVLTVIGLFDGDIRQRHLAESHLPVLGEWNDAMLESARRAARSGELVARNMLDRESGGSSDTALLAASDASLPQRDPTEALWHAWIVAESVRRTWLVMRTVEISYAMMLRGTINCHGGVMLTTLEGVWDAPSSWEWAGICAERDVGFVKRGEAARLFGERRPEEVDEFGKLVLETGWGCERMERWGVTVDYEA